MGMDRLAERLAEGQPPLRVSEFARLIGYSREYVRKALDAKVIESVSALRPDIRRPERRIPVQEAVKLARALRLLE